MFPLPNPEGGGQTLSPLVVTYDSHCPLLQGGRSLLSPTGFPWGPGSAVHSSTDSCPWATSPIRDLEDQRFCEPKTHGQAVTVTARQSCQRPGHDSSCQGGRSRLSLCCGSGLYNRKAHFAPFRLEFQMLPASLSSLLSVAFPSLTVCLFPEDPPVLYTQHDSHSSSPQHLPPRITVAEILTSCPGEAPVKPA